MKTLKRLLLLALALILSMSVLAGCNRDNNDDDRNVPVEADPNKVIKVESLKSGFGDDWLIEMKKKFEAAYADEGYYVKLEPSSSDMRGDTVVRLLSRGYAKEKTDLYVTGDITDNMIDTTNAYTPGTPLAYNVKDLVFNQKAINTDGTLEEKTVLEKIQPAMRPYIYNAKEDAYYGMPTINSVTGIVINMSNLAKFGYTEPPRTTDELIAMAESIYTGKKADGTDYSEGASPKSHLFPFTYATETQYGVGMYTIPMAQMDLDFYNTFRTFIDKDGNRLINDGYEVYKDERVIDAMEMMYFSYDPKLAAYGSRTDTLDVVQGKMVAKSGDRAVFMYNGDWMLNEVINNFSNAADVLDFYNLPLTSDLADEVFTDLSHAEADKLMSYVAKLVDSNMDIADIVADVTTNKGYAITTEQAERIAYARGLYQLRGVEARAMIVPDSPKKEISALFLRMIASEGGSQIIAEKANQTSSFATKANTFSSIKYVQNASKIAVNQYAEALVWRNNGLREEMKLNSHLYSQGEFLPMLWQEGTPSMYNNGKVVAGATWDGIYGANARARLEAVYNLFKDNWAQKLADNNITE